MNTRQTVLRRTKEAFEDNVKEKRDKRIALVIIFLGTEGEPKRRFVPAKERVT